MVTIDGAWFQLLMHDTTILDTTAEAIIDQAINLLNTYGAGISNLVAGTGSYTSAQAGAIGSIAQQIYQQFYKNASGANVNAFGIGLSYSNTMLLSFARQLARQLSGMDFRRT